MESSERSRSRFLFRRFDAALRLYGAGTLASIRFLNYLLII